MTPRALAFRHSVSVPPSPLCHRVTVPSFGGMEEESDIGGDGGGWSRGFAVSGVSQDTHLVCLKPSTLSMHSTCVCLKASHAHTLSHTHNVTHIHTHTHHRSHLSMRSRRSVRL